MEIEQQTQTTWSRRLEVIAFCLDGEAQWALQDSLTVMARSCTLPIAGLRWLDEQRRIESNAVMKCHSRELAAARLSL